MRGLRFLLLRHNRQIGIGPIFSPSLKTSTAVKCSQNFLSYGFSFSYSSSPNQDKNEEKPKFPLSSNLLNATTRGIGQIIFLNSAKSGQLVVLGLTLGDPTLAGFACLGGLTATSTARWAKLDEKAYEDGLWGYNGALIGCAVSVFGSSFMPYSIASTVVGATITPFLSASLKSALSIPQWTWSFNFVALTYFLRTRPLKEVTTPIDSTSLDGFEDAPGLLDLALSPLTGISQIFVVDSCWTGATIVAAIRLYSPKLGLHALGGSAVGGLVGLLSGAEMTDLASGIWSYNSALTSLSVGTFFVHSRQTIALSATGAAAAAALFGAMQPVFFMHGAPCLTLPFCSVASASYFLVNNVSGLALAKVPHSPEKNI